MEHLAQGLVIGASGWADIREALRLADLVGEPLSHTADLARHRHRRGSAIVLMVVGQGTTDQTMRNWMRSGIPSAWRSPQGQEIYAADQASLTEADAQVARSVPNIELAVPAFAEQIILRTGSIERRTKMWAVNERGPATISRHRGARCSSTSRTSAIAAVMVLEVRSKLNCSARAMGTTQSDSNAL